jgi:hypothetical protein
VKILRVTSQLQVSTLKLSKCTSKKPNFLIKEMSKFMQHKTKEQETTFSKLMIVEIDLRNVMRLIMQQMRKKESQKEFLFVKFRIKETDLIIQLLTAPCVRKKVNVMN